MASLNDDSTIPSTSHAQYSELPENLHRRPGGHRRRRPSPGSSNSTVVNGVGVSSPLLGRSMHANFATDPDEPTNAQPTYKEDKMEFKYPHPTLSPLLTRKHVTLIAISGTIGTGLFLGSGSALVDAGPLGIFLGYLVMSTVVYGLVVSSAEMVSVYPYCRGQFGLADRFVDPALGFAMGWNATYSWGLTIPSQIAAVAALVKYWHPSEALAWACPAIFIVFTTSSVLGARVYGEFESFFALIKLSVAALLIIMAFAFDVHDASHQRNPLRFWDPPITQYLDIPGPKGRFLAFCAVFMQAAIAFSGTEIPTVIGGELKDAPRVIYAVSKRVWFRVSILYLLTIFAAGTLVSREELKAQIAHLVPDDPSTPKNDAPWASSPFLTALAKAGSSYNWVSNICIACFITSAASAASAEVFISARCLYFLAEAGHAPAFFGAVWPKKSEGVIDNRAVVPYVGVVATVGFATISWLRVRPAGNTMSEMERTFSQIAIMTTAACLQAWVGNLFTYYRFWKGTCHKENKIKYSCFQKAGPNKPTRHFLSRGLEIHSTGYTPHFYKLQSIL